MKRLFLTFLIAGNFACAEDCINRTIGVVDPFEINPAVESVPASFTREFNGGVVLPAKYAEYLQSKNMFREVVAIKIDEPADYYIKGYVEKINYGERISRCLLAPFGAGRSSLEIHISVLDSKRKLIFEQDIVQKARRSGSPLRSTTWSHEANLQTAIAATYNDVYTLVIRSVIEHEDQNLGSMLTPDHPELIRKASMMVDDGTLSPSKGLAAAYSGLIDAYIANLDPDPRATDAIAWVCSAIGSANMSANAIDLEKLLRANISPKIQRHAEEALTKLGR